MIVNFQCQRIFFDFKDLAVDIRPQIVEPFHFSVNNKELVGSSNCGKDRRSIPALL